MTRTNPQGPKAFDPRRALREVRRLAREILTRPCAESSADAADLAVAFDALDRALSSGEPSPWTDGAT